WLPLVMVVWAVLLLGAIVALVASHVHTYPAQPLSTTRRHAGAGARGGWLIMMLLILPPLTVYAGTSPRSFFYTPRVEARYLFPFIWSFSLVLAWSVWR